MQAIVFETWAFLLTYYLFACLYILLCHLLISASRPNLSTVGLIIYKAGIVAYSTLIYVFHKMDRKVE